MSSSTQEVSRQRRTVTEVYNGILQWGPDEYQLFRVICFRINITWLQRAGYLKLYMIKQSGSQFAENKAFLVCNFSSVLGIRWRELLSTGSGRLNCNCQCWFASEAFATTRNTDTKDGMWHWNVKGCCYLDKQLLQRSKAPADTCAAYPNTQMTIGGLMSTLKQLWGTVQLQLLKN